MTGDQTSCTPKNIFGRLSAYPKTASHFVFEKPFYRHFRGSG